MVSSQYSREDLTPEYFFSEIDHDVRSSLSEVQKKEILKILNRAVRIPSKKILNINFTFWFIKRFYITIYFGLNKRRSKRINSTRKRDSILALLMKTALYLFMIMIVLSVLFFTVYFIKTELGIDIFKDKHLRDFLQ